MPAPSVPRPTLRGSRCAVRAAAALGLAALVLPARASQAAAEPESGAALYADWLRTLDTVAEPSAVRFDDAGGAWILSSGEHALVRVDAEGRRIQTIGGFGEAAGRFRDPEGLARGDGRLAVADTGNDRIQIFDERGAPLAVFGARGSAPGELREPAGLDLRGELLAVAERGNDRVQVFAADGGALLAFGRHGRGAGELDRPSAVAWLADGGMAVADTGNQRVQVFDAQGAFVRAFGTWGALPGTFAGPAGLAEAGGFLYVVDRDNHRVQVFEEDGTLVDTFGLHAIVPREGAGRLHYPSALDVRPDLGMLALAEPSDDRVQVLGPGAEEAWRRRPSGDAAVYASPHFGAGIAADGALLAVVQPESARVALFDTSLSEAIEIARAGSFGSGPGAFREPADALVDAARDRVWVSDPSERALQLFELERDRAAGVQQLALPPRFVKRLGFAGWSGARAAPSLVRTVEPTSLAFGPDGGILVVDRANACALLLGPELELRCVLGLPGELDRPVDVAWHAGSRTAFVVDLGRRRVVAFALGDEPPAPGAAALGASFAFGAEGSGPGRFRAPFGIAVDRAGSLWIADRGAALLQRFDVRGAHQSSFGAPGLGAGEFHRPTGICALADGGLAVVDQGNHRLQLFGEDGRFRSASGARLYTRPALRER